MKKLSSRSLLLLSIVLSLTSWSQKDSNPVLTIKGGQVKGLETPTKGIIAYKGIPFAAPPVGNLRWKEPQPVVGWQGVKKCEAFGASPMQGSPSPFGPWSEEYLIPKEPISEDCLTLNVWTGAKSAREKLP